MIQVSRETWEAFDRRMGQAGVEPGERTQWRKWVRYYLDFCAKYGHEPRLGESLGPFLEKLRSKGQSDAQREAASRGATSRTSPRATSIPGT